MTLISITPDDARQSGLTMKVSASTLDDMHGRLSGQWSRLSATWQGAGKGAVEAEVEIALGQLSRLAARTRADGTELNAIAECFEAADENMPFAVATVAWSALAGIGIGTIAVPVPTPVPTPTPGIASPSGESPLDFIRRKFELSGKGNILEIGKEKKGSHYKNYKDTAFNPEIGVKYGVAEGALLERVSDKDKSDKISFFGGSVDLDGSVGLDTSKGLGKPKVDLDVGVSAELHAVKADYDTILAGSTVLGLTGAVGVTAVAVEGFAGIKDGEVGATIGATLVSAKGEIGANVAGMNVGVNAEVGLKAELGFKIGRNGAAVKLPFVSFGVSFGGARE